MTQRRDPMVLVTIVVAQFCGTSLWFAGNAVLPQLQQLYGWSQSSLGYLTASIQLGFIAGTMLFAIRGISDRYSPSKIFLVCCIAGAACNALSLVYPSSLEMALLSRMLTGFFLAGIYPVGMKIAADYREEGLGHWLGALVGALVLGTAFPHALKLFPMFSEFRLLIVGVSLVALSGGIMLHILVPDGPYRSKTMPFDFGGIRQAFRIKEFRAAAFGYFGHMWELYAFWAFIPFLIDQYNVTHQIRTISWLSFIVIAIGAAGCIIGGFISKKTGSFRVALYALITSGVCCLLSPWIFQVDSIEVLIAFMV
jgi:MFS family permease